MVSQTHYEEHQRQMAWINTEGWQFEQPAKRYRMRYAIARALVRLAILLTPPAQEARPAER
jgi:hypothetical protein